MLKIFIQDNDDARPAEAHIFDGPEHVGTSYSIFHRQEGVCLLDAQELARAAIERWRANRGTEPLDQAEVALALHEKASSVIAAHEGKRVLKELKVYDEHMAERFADRGMLLAYVSLCLIAAQARRPNDSWITSKAGMADHARSDLVREIAEDWLANGLHSITDPHLAQSFITDSFESRLDEVGLVLPATATTMLPPGLPFLRVSDAELVAIQKVWTRHGEALIAPTKENRPSIDLGVVSQLTSLPRALEIREGMQAVRSLCLNQREQGDAGVELPDIVGYGQHYGLVLGMAIELMPATFIGASDRSPAVARAVNALIQREVIDAQSNRQIRQGR